jgi:phenylacetate-CoA ligase
MSLYSQILEGAIWPVHNRLLGRRYARYRRELDHSQWWSREALRDLQWRQLSALLDVAFADVPYYREKYGRAGFRREDIRSLEDYARLPILHRSEVRENRDRLRNTAFGGRLVPHATGGSTGVPTQFFITIDSCDWRAAATQRVYAWTGCRLGDRSVYLWGAPVGTPSPWEAFKTTVYERLQRQLVFNTFQQTDALWERIRQRIDNYRPELMVGYVSSMQEFCAYLRRSGQAVPRLRALIAAAEPVFPAVREEIESTLQAPLFNTYGSREFMSIGGECERRDGLHINAENLLVETAFPAEASELLVTDLRNFGMPFLRYEIGDVGVLDLSSCACGRGLPRIRSIQGRILDMLRTPDGRIVPGEFFPHIIKDLPEVREFQVQQKSLDHIVISAILAAPLSPRSNGILESEVQKTFGNVTRVELQPVESIPRLPSGKRRVTIGLPN